MTEKILSKTKQKKALEGRLSAAVYKDIHGQAFIVFNRKSEDRRNLRALDVQTGKETVLTETKLIELHNLRLKAHRNLSRQKEIELNNEDRSILKNYSSNARKNISLDYSFVPRFLGVKRNSLVRQISTIQNAAKIEGHPDFHPEEELTVRKKNTDTYLELPPVAVDENGRPLAGTAQTSALIQCKKLGLPMLQGGIFALSHKKARDSVPVNVSTYDKDKGTVNDYIFYSWSAEKIPESALQLRNMQVQRIKEISRMRKDGKPLGDVKISVKDDQNISLADYAARKQAARIAGVPFECSDAITERLEKEYNQRMEEFKRSPDYERFYADFHRSVERKAEACVKSIAKEIEQSYMRAIERTRGARSVSELGR